MLFNLLNRISNLVFLRGMKRAMNESLLIFTSLLLPSDAMFTCDVGSDWNLGSLFSGSCATSAQQLCSGTATPEERHEHDLTTVLPTWQLGGWTWTEGSAPALQRQRLRKDLWQPELGPKLTAVYTAVLHTFTTFNRIDNRCSYICLELQLPLSYRYITTTHP